MSYVTLEVEIDHGRVVAGGAEKLPETAKGLLIIFPPGVTDLKASSHAVDQNVMPTLAHVSAGSRINREELNERSGETQTK